MGHGGGHRRCHLIILRPLSLAVKPIRPRAGAGQDTPWRAFHRGRAAGRFPWPLLLCVALTGCGPEDPLDIRVDAKNYVAFSMWESDASSRLTAQQLKDFNEALQEIKFRIMADGAAAGRDGVERAAWEMIDEKTVRDMLRMGLSRELERVQAEQAALARSMDQNRRLITRPDDVASKSYLSFLHEREAEHLNAVNAQISHARERLAAYGLTAEISALPPPGINEASEPASEDEPPVLLTPRNSDR